VGTSESIAFNIIRKANEPSIRKMLARTTLVRAVRQCAPARRSIQTVTRPRLNAPTFCRAASHTTPLPLNRWLSSRSTVDEKMEEITELYATAQDEFEIAMEETEKATVYAEDDRNAAREELTKLQNAYQAIVEGSDQHLAEEVKRRVGQRIRELEQGVAAMEELAMQHD
jgi:hypothetical protein